MVAVSNRAVEYPEKKSTSFPMESLYHLKVTNDVITNVESLYYYPEPQAALNEWYRVAKIVDTDHDGFVCKKFGDPYAD